MNFVHRANAGTCLGLHEMSEVKEQTPAITITAVQVFLPDPEICYNDTNKFSFEAYCIDRDHREDNNQAMTKCHSEYHINAQINSEKFLSW